MLSIALRRIGFSHIVQILIPAAIAAIVIAATLFLPTEVLAADGGRLSCSGMLQPFGECMQIAATYIVNALVAVAAWVLYWAGMLFEATLRFSIQVDYNGLSAVKSGWTVIRDLVNLLFIFILLYIAIGTVLRIESVNWKKQLAAIIIAAVLVNFSLFLTRLVIDGSNIISLGLYNKITACEEPTDPPLPPGSDPVCTGRGGPDESISISEAIMNSLGLPKFFDSSSFGSDSELRDGLRNGLIRLTLIGLVVWAFVSVALLFIGRTIVFVFLLTTSPVGVAGASLPMLQDPAKKWRDNLFNQSLVAPVFLLMMYIILKMASDLLGMEGETAELTGDMGTDDDEHFWLNFVLLIGFIIAAVSITKKYSGEVGKMLNKAGSAAVGIGLGLATGGAALAARTAVGGAATRTLANEDLKASARGGSRIAQMRLNAADTLSRSSMDPRQSKFGKSITKGLEKQGLKGVGLTQNVGRGGVEAATEAQEKRVQAASKRYAPSQEYSARRAAEQNNLEADRVDQLAREMEESARKMPLNDKLRERKMESVHGFRQRAADYRSGKAGISAKQITQAEQLRFAESVERDSFWKKVRRGTKTDGFGNMDRRAKRAADGVRNNINKTETDKLVDALKQAQPKDKDDS